MGSTTPRADQVSSAEGVAADELRQFIERIERLEDEKAGILGDIKEVFAEAKGRGFDTKAMRTIVRMRKQDFSERQEQEAILELYMQALGMLADTPLGRAAVSRDLGEGRAAGRIARDPKVQRAINRLGRPVPRSDREKALGAVAAFEMEDGTRCSIQVGRGASGVARRLEDNLRGVQTDLEDAIAAVR